MNNDLLTVSEVARALRVDSTTVRRWIKQGTLTAVILPHIRRRKAYRIQRDIVDAILFQSSPNLAAGRHA